MSVSTGSQPRCALVTGGASGIGRGLAEELARTGVGVVLADRQLELAEEVAEGIRKQGGTARATELDVRDAADFDAVVAETFAQAGRLDYLFNNAGIGVGGEIRDYELADWDDVLDVNLRGVCYGIQAAYPRMIEQGFGHIINTASMAGLTIGPFATSYGASKHAVVAISRALRIEARDLGVRVSVICPGVIRTPILQGGAYGRLRRLDPQQVMEAFERGRPLDPNELARRVLRAVERNRLFIIEPRGWRLLWYLERLSPGLYDRLSALGLGRMRKLLRAP